jgi:hypothetical protein
MQENHGHVTISSTSEWNTKLGNVVVMSLKRQEYDKQER